MVRRAWLAMMATALLGGCAGLDAADTSAGASDDSAVTVDTRKALARAQYDANVAFASGYAPRCRRSADPRRPRVLVTGFGRFMSIDDNATGRMVSALVPAAEYPATHAPEAGAIDLPGPQLSVGTVTLDVDGVGPVDVCGMILPVYWDLAAILIAKEAAAFEPSFVMMNGVAAPRQSLWLELGSVNRAAPSEDGSNILTPYVEHGASHAKLVDDAPESEASRPNLLSWRAVERAATVAIREESRQASEEAIAEARSDDAGRFGDVLLGAEIAGFPRMTNTYLCNSVTYVTGYLMGHRGESVSLLRASHPKPGAQNEVNVRIDADLSRVPRVFVHWPSELSGSAWARGARVMKAMIGAQLRALDAGDAPTFGDNQLASPSLPAGTFF